MNYLTSHVAELGVTRTDIQNSIVTDQYFSPEIGLTHIYLRQEVGGIEIVNANLNVNVTSEGRILSVSGGFVPARYLRMSNPHWSPWSRTRCMPWML